MSEHKVLQLSISRLSHFATTFLSGYTYVNINIYIYNYIYIFTYIRWAQTCKLCNYCTGQWWPSRKCLNWVFLGWATLPSFLWNIYKYIYIYICICVCKHIWIYIYIYIYFSIVWFIYIYIYIEFFFECYF